MQVGTTKDQGLYNKPSTAVHPGALAAGTLPQYNNIHLLKLMTSISLHNVSTLHRLLYSSSDFPLKEYVFFHSVLMCLIAATDVFVRLAQRFM